MDMTAEFAAAADASHRGVRRPLPPETRSTIEKFVTDSQT